MAEKTVDLKVSISTYNEIVEQMNKHGKKIETGAIITLEKDVKILNPIDWRMLAVRQNIMDIATKVYTGYDSDGNRSSKEFVQFVDECYQYVLEGVLPQRNTDNVLKSVPTTKTDIWK